MNPSSRRALRILALLAPLALSAPAAAQDVAAAERLFNHGLAEMEARNFTVGCAEIAESQRLDPRPGTLYTLAQCEVRWGRIATAVTRLGDYLQVYEGLTPEQKERQRERPKVARDQREKLAPEVPELTLVLPPGAPVGTEVKRDGAIVAAAALGLALPVDPGEHVIATQAPGEGVRETRITLGKGEKRRLTLELGAAARAGGAESPPEQHASEAPAGPSRRRVAAYAVGGVGVASLVLGGVMGGLALGKKAILQDNCGPGTDPRHPTDATACTPAGLAAASSIKPLGLVSTIGFAAGIAGVGSAIVLLVTEHRSSPSARDAQRPWISAGLLAAGPEGAMAGAQGSW
jgi:hypothetical protein